MLVIQRKKDQTIKIGDDVEITVVKIGDTSIKLGINAPKDVRVKRGEELGKEKSENKEETTEEEKKKENEKELKNTKNKQ